MFLGGLTPTLGSLIEAKANVGIPVLTMVRPREAGFFYSDYEYSVMKLVTKLLLENGAGGFIFGAVNPSIHFGGALYPREDVVSVASKETITLMASELGR